MATEGYLRVIAGAGSGKTKLLVSRYAYLVKEYGIDALPEPLKDAALLRIANPEASLADLAKLSYPPVTKSCISHRLKKIMSLASKE